MYNYKNKTSFVSPKISKAWSNNTNFIILIVHFNICRKLDIIQNNT